MSLIPPNMAPMATSPVRAFPYGIGRFPNTVPFTFRDGSTFSEMFEQWIQWVEETVIPEIVSNANMLTDAYNVASQSLKEAMDKYTESITLDRNEFNAAVAATLNKLAADIAANETKVEDALDGAIAARNLAEQWAANTQVLQDGAVANLLKNPSATITALAAIMRGYQRKGDMFTGFATAIQQGAYSFGVTAVGDSTTVPDAAWFRLLANYYANKYPNYVHLYRKWNDGIKEFDPPITLNSPAGAVKRAMQISAQGNNSQRVGGQISGPNISGDLDIRIHLNQATYAPGELQTLMAKWTNDADRSWVLYLNPTGTLRVQVFNGSTAVLDKNSAGAITGVDGTDLWIRAVIQPDNGAAGSTIKFYTSVDGVNWASNLGADVVTAGVVTIGQSNSRYVYGNRGSTSLSNGTKIYNTQVRDGINGPNVVPYLPEHWISSIGIYQPSTIGTPVINWVMGGMSGGGLGYDYQSPTDIPAGTTANYLTRWARNMSPDYGPLITFHSSSHNDYYAQGSLWTDRLTNWINLTCGNKPQSARVVLTQNPRDPDVGDVIGHQRRRSQTLEWGRRTGGIDVLDTYQAFVNDGRPLKTLIGDGTHPTTEGYLVWYNFIRAEMDAAISKATPFGSQASII